MNVQSETLNDTKDLRILFIGNSFTFVNDMSGKFTKLAEAAGYHPYVERIATSAITLSEMADRNTEYGEKVYKTLTSTEWDYVILQEQSQKPITQPETSTYPAIRTLNQWIEAASAKTVLYMTWGYDNNMRLEIDSVPISLNRVQMQRILAKNYYYIGNSIGAQVSPIGLAFGQCQSIYPEISLVLDSDLYHPNESGAYLAACTMYTTIYQKSPLGNSYIADLNSETALHLQQIADRRISINRQSATLDQGESVVLTAGITESDSNTLKANEVVQWRSMNENIAVVDEQGKVTGLRYGETMVEAYTKSGLSILCNITVKPKTTENKISINKQNVSIFSGHSVVLTAVMTHVKSNTLPDSDTDTIYWRSMDENVAVVGSYGKVTGLHYGTTKIEAYTKSGLSAICSITVKQPILAIESSLNSLKLQVGERQRIPIVTVPSKTDDSLQWRSSDSNIAKVSSKGMVVAVAPGYSRITVTSDSGKIVKCRVYVKLDTPKITSFKMLKTKANQYSISIKWKKVKGAASYYIYRKKSSKSSYKKIANVTSTKYIDKNCTYGKNYYYTIVAVHPSQAACNSTKTGAKHLFVPKSPTSVMLKHTDETGLHISWKKVSNASGYEIYRSTNRATGYKKIERINHHNTYQYTDVSTRKGKQYYYKIRAYRIIDGKRIYGMFSKPVMFRFSF